MVGLVIGGDVGILGVVIFGRFLIEEKESRESQVECVQVRMDVLQQCRRLTLRNFCLVYVEHEFHC